MQMKKNKKNLVCKWRNHAYKWRNVCVRVCACVCIYLIYPTPNDAAK